MARSRTCRIRCWGPYAGLLVTGAMLMISSNIAHLEQQELYTTYALDMESVYGRRETLDPAANGSITTDVASNIRGCQTSLPDADGMNRTQDTRLREMWRNCNRCTTTVAPHMTSHPSNVTSCGWQKRTLVPRMLGNLLVDDRHKTMYCVIPKVACTNWKRALVRMSGRINVTDDELLRTMDVHDEGMLSQFGLRYLNTYPLEEIRSRMDSYFKFMFVRHPLERLLSAYRDKFIPHNKWTEHFQLKYGRHIVKTHRRNPTLESLQEGHDVTFLEFVHYVTTSSWEEKPHNNPHWSSFYDLCHPCSIKYDFIGRFESFSTDAPYVLGKLSGSSCPPRFPNMKPTGASTRQVMLDYYNQIPRADISRLVQVFLPDFVMFGYDLNFSGYLRRNV